MTEENIRKWGLIYNDSTGYYQRFDTDPIISDFAKTPAGNYLTDDSSEVIDLLAQSMNDTGESLLYGLSLYAIHSSYIDFGFAAQKSNHVDVLISAFDDCKKEKKISKNDWVSCIKTVSPQNLAVLMTICGTVGWPEVAYNIVTNYSLPPLEWFQHICALRQANGNPDLLLDLAYQNEAFGELVINDDSRQANCQKCSASNDDCNPDLCSIYTIFDFIREYAMLSQQNITR